MKICAISSMKSTFTDNQIGGCIGCILTAGMLLLSILAVSVLKYDRAIVLCLMLLFVLAVCVEMYLGWRYTRYNSNDRIRWSVPIVAFGMIGLCVAMAAKSSADLIDIILASLFLLLPSLACSLFLHSSLVILLRRTDWGLYLSQVFCVATMAHCCYWLAQI